MDLIVKPNGWLHRGQFAHRCALGRAGIAASKVEADGATPVGRFPLRRLYYRADRIAAPKTGLPVSVIGEGDGWCDDPACASYNSLVALPHTGSHEYLCRDDGLYDIVVQIGHNDDPAVPGLGSGIFLHVAAADYAPTEGCVALAIDDLRSVIADCDTRSVIAIQDRSGTALI
jgi:L,D-peptidoglycan transpeptidase YkuD (ErfK/YbiS/YcfS/YnhG family)